MDHKKKTKTLKARSLVTGQVKQLAPDEERQNPLTSDSAAKAKESKFITSYRCTLYSQEICLMVTTSPQMLWEQPMRIALYCYYCSVVTLVFSNVHPSLLAEVLLFPLHTVCICLCSYINCLTNFIFSCC